MGYDASTRDAGAYARDERDDREETEPAVDVSESPLFRRSRATTVRKEESTASKTEGDAVARCKR